MAIDTTTTPLSNEAALAVNGLVDIALTGFSALTVESEHAVIQLASLSGLPTNTIIGLLDSEQGRAELANNQNLLKNADIALQIAGISTGILEQGLNAQALAQNTDFLQVAHYVYDRENGDGAWAARIRSEIEDSLWRELSDEEYASRNALYAIAAEHGVQSEEFLKASVEAHAEFPQHSHRGPNARIREVEYSLNQAVRRVRDAEREIEFIQNDDSLTAEEKTQQLDFAQRELELATEARDRWAVRWGREFVQPIRNNESELKLAETLFDRLSNTDEFLAQAKAEYDRLAASDTPPRPSWDEHIAQLNAEYEASWNPFKSKPDADALLTEWGKGRIEQKMGLGQFDFSKMEEFGLDTGLFEASDLQNQREDTAQADIGGRFGRAWLHAAEIVYNGKNDTPWAEHLNTELSATLDDAASPAERAAAEALIKTAVEHGAASAEFMDATQKFLEDYPESATGARLLKLNSDLAKEGEWALRWQDGNVASAIRTEGIEFLGIEGRSEEFQAAVRYLVRLDEYTRYEWGNDFWQDFGVGALDPTQIISLAATGVVTVYSGGTGSAPTIAGTQAARAGLVSLFSGVTRQSVAQAAKTGVVLNAAEGFIGEAGIESFNQDTEMGLGVRSEKDNVAILMRGGGGAAAGVVLGAGFGAGSHVSGKFVSNFFKNTNVGQGISIRAAEIRSSTVDFITFKPHSTALEVDAGAPQLGPTIEAAAKLDAEEVVTPAATTALAPEATTIAPTIKAPEVPAETPAVPVRTAPPAATHPLGILSGMRLPGMPEPVFAPLRADGFDTGRPVFSPADSNRGATPPPASPSGGKRHAVNRPPTTDLIENLDDAEKVFLRDRTPEAREAYDTALEAVNAAMINTTDFSERATTRLTQAAYESQGRMKDVLDVDAPAKPTNIPAADDAVNADSIRLLIAEAKAEAFEAGQGNMDISDAAKALRENLTNIRNNLSDDIPAAERAALIAEISRESANAFDIVRGIDTTAPRPGPSTRVEEPTTAPRPHPEAEETIVAPETRAEGEEPVVTPETRAEEIDADADIETKVDKTTEIDTSPGSDKSIGYETDRARIRGGVTEEIFKETLEIVPPVGRIIQPPKTARLRTDSRSVRDFHDNLSDSVKRFVTALEKGAPPEKAHKIFQKEIIELHQSLSRMGNYKGKKYKTSPDGLTLSYGTYERDINITDLQKDGLRVTLDKALDMGEELRKLDGKDGINKYLQDVAFRAQNIADNTPHQTVLNPHDALILSFWKHGKNLPDDSGKYKTGITNVSQIRLLRYLIEEAGDMYARDAGPTPFLVPNAENVGGHLRKLILVAGEGDGKATPGSYNFAGEWPAYDNAARSLVNNGLMHGLTVADLVSELNFAVARTKKANPFVDFNEFLQHVEKQLSTKKKANGELVESITHSDGRVEITDPAVVPIIKRLRRQQERFWNKNNQGTTFNTIIWGKSPEGHATVDPRMLRETSMYSLNVTNSALRYRVNPSGERSAAGAQLYEARKSRIPSVIGHLLIGDTLNVAKTKENLKAQGASFSYSWNGIGGEWPDGFIPKLKHTGKVLLTQPIKIAWRALGGDAVPLLVKFAPDHWAGGKMQLWKHSRPLKAITIVGAPIGIALNPVTYMLGINPTPWAVSTAWSFVTGSDTTSTPPPPTPTDTTGGDADPVVDVSNTDEAIKIRQWVTQNRDNADLKLPNYMFSGDDDAYIDSIISKAAELLIEKPGDYPNVRWSATSDDNDFTQVWNAARDQVNAELRNEYIKNAAAKAYASLTGREETYNFAGNENLNFDKVVGWLQANTDNIAPINPNTLMPTDPWETNAAAFTAAVKAHEDSLSPEAIQARKDAALAGFAADRGVAVLALNDAEKEAAGILAEAFKNPDIGLFYTAEELSGNSDTSKALRSSTLADVNAAIEQRAREAAIEAAKQARIQAALIGYANDKGSGLEGLTDAEKAAAEMMAETKDASGAFHTDAYLSGIAGRAKRQSLLTATVEAAAETERRRNNPNVPDGIDLSIPLDQTKQAGANVLNWITDTDNDGYSALIDTDWGRALSGSLQQAGGAIGNLWGNLNQTEGGRQTIGISAGIIAALALPSFASRLPILGTISKIPVVGGLLIAAFGFFAATKSADALYKMGPIFSNPNPDTDPAKNGNAEVDKDGDGDQTDTGNGGAQGGGGYIDKNAVGHVIRTQPHDGGLPQIITLEGDFDNDPDTQEVLHFFDLDGDGQYAAQMARDGESISFAAPEILSGAKLQGAMNFIDNIARAKAEATGKIEISRITNNGGAESLTLTINGEDFALDHKLETPLDNPYLSQSLETQ